MSARKLSFWVASIMCIATPTYTANLLVNPQFDQDPTAVDSPWKTTGTGTFLWWEFSGQPNPPAAQTWTSNDQSMILWQCVAIVGDTPYDFSAQSFTNSGFGAGSQSSVTLSVYSSTDCSGVALENVPTDSFSTPNWTLRQKVGYVPPVAAMSARIELESTAGVEGNMNILWDNVIIDGQSADGADDPVYIEVTKQFTDGNTETPVTLSLNCSSGTYAPASVTVTPDEYGFVRHTFPVRSVPLSGIPECTVVEEPVPGYATEYWCPQEDSDSTTDVSCQPVADDVPEDNFACKWVDVEAGDWNRCQIFNDPEPVAVEVTKVWEQNGTGGDYVKQKAEITIFCDAWIVNGYYKHGKWKLRETLNGWDGDFPDGVGTVTAWVVPEWYPSDSGDSTVCWAREDDIDSSVEVESDCGDSEYPGMEVSVRTGGDSCTITNTIFFEGIPTLNQYGLALMALLMLGLGAVGFRRFV